MKVIKNKKGISFPAMLAIVIFVVSSLFGLITYARFQNKLVEKNIKFSEEFVNAKTDIAVVQMIIAKNQITDNDEIIALTDYFNLEFTVIDEVIYRFSREMNNVNRSVISYLAPMTEGVLTYEEIFSFTGSEENFSISPLINATSMLSSYTIDYLSTSFPDLTLDSSFEDFNDIVDYYRSLTDDYYQMKQPNAITNLANPRVSDYWFIDGDVVLNNKNLTVDPGYTLVIDGDLLTNRNTSISGNIIINGDFIVDGRNRDSKAIVGTFYVNGDFSSANKSTIGQPSRPNFIFATEDVYLGNQTTVYGYFMANNFYGSHGNTFVSGGIYTYNETDVHENNLTEYSDLETEDLETYAVTSTITTESSGGSSSFTYTTPRLE